MLIFLLCTVCMYCTFYPEITVHQIPRLRQPLFFYPCWFVPCPTSSWSSIAVGRSVSERESLGGWLTDWLTDVSFAYLVMEWMDELVDRALVLRRVWLRPNCDSKSSQRNLQLEFERDTSKLLDEIWGMRPNFIPWPEFEKPRPWQEVAKSWHSINSGH